MDEDDVGERGSADGSDGRRDRKARARLLTPEQERWAEAIAIERMRGEDAVPWVNERIDALLRQGGLEGAERFIQIRERLAILGRGAGLQ